MTITRINSNNRLSGAVTFQDLVFLSGQVPGEGQDVTTQTQEVLAKIDALLAEAGSDKHKLLMVTIYLADMADYDGMNAVWDAWLPEGAAPTRACVQARLANPGWRVEMVITAAQ